jgi:hypothetical protein
MSVKDITFIWEITGVIIGFIIALFVPMLLKKTNIYNTFKKKVQSIKYRILLLIPCFILIMILYAVIHYNYYEVPTKLLDTNVISFSIIYGIEYGVIWILIDIFLVKNKTN